MLPFDDITASTLVYDPPYERPIDDEFAWHLIKYLRTDAKLDYQVCVPLQMGLMNTDFGRLWIDFVVTHDVAGKARCIAFDIEDRDDQGAGDPAWLRQRDALLVSRCVDVLYRFRMVDVLHRLHDCLYLVAQHEGDLFSQRGHTNLNTLASSTVRGYAPKPSDVIHLVYEKAKPGVFGRPAGSTDLLIRRFDRSAPEHWIRDYDKALSNPS